MMNMFLFLICIWCFSLLVSVNVDVKNVHTALWAPEAIHWEKIELGLLSINWRHVSRAVLWTDLLNSQTSYGMLIMDFN